jgi:hypothetical protein
MKSLSPLYLFFLLATAVTVVSSVGCSRSANKSERHDVPPLEQTPNDEAFAKAHGAVWITTKLDPIQSKQFTLDFQDGLFSPGSILACDLLVKDVHRENGVPVVTGVSLSNFGEFEIEIATNMLSSIRVAGGKFSFVRIAFQVQSFEHIENYSQDDAVVDKDSIRGRALAVDPISETAKPASKL